MKYLARFVAAIGILILVVVVLAVGAFAFLFGTESGERFVQAQTTSALGRLLGPRYEATLAQQHFEFRPDGTLALNWRDVVLRRKDAPDNESRVDRVSVALRLMPLVSGSLEFGRLEIDGARVDLEAFAGHQTDVGEKRPAPAPGSLMTRTADRAISTLERQLKTLRDFHFDTLSLDNIVVEGVKVSGGPSHTVELRHAELHRAIDGTLRLTSQLRAGELPVVLSGTARFDPETERLQQFTARSGRIALEDFLPPADKADVKDERPFGSNSEASFELDLTRDAEADTATASASMHIGKGDLQLGLNRTEIEDIQLNLSFREGDTGFVVEPSPLRFRDVEMELRGRADQIDVGDTTLPERFRFQIGSDAIRSRVGLEDPGVSPQTAKLSLEGEFDAASRRVILSRSLLAAGDGTLQATGGYDGSAPDARTTLYVSAANLSVASVRAFWPFMISGKARRWVLEHIENEGLVPNGTIGIDIARDRMGPAFKPGGNPSETELRVDVAIQGARVMPVGDVPPLVEAAGTVQTRGGRTVIDVEGAKAEGFGSVTLQPAQVVLERPPNGGPRDLQVDLTLHAAGDVAELLHVADREPIHAFRTVPLQIDPFKGRAAADVSAVLRFGDDIPKSEQVANWSVDAKLDGVDPGQAIQGRRFAALKGNFRVIPGQASGSVDGTMDDLPASLDFALPFGEKPVGSRSVEVGLKVSSKKAVELLPALKGVVDGPIDARIVDGGEGLDAEIDLTRTALDLPAVAWKKGAGVPAKIAFDLTRDGSITTLRDMRIKGDGFSADGSIVLDEGGLRKADLSHVALNPNDSVRVAVERHKSGFGVKVEGERFDARPILAEIKSGLGREKKGRVGGGTFDVIADVDRLDGFNGKSVGGFSLNYAASDGQLAALAMSGTIGGVGVSGDLSPRDDQRRIRIASDDVGGFLGFAGLYDHMEGGQGGLTLLGTGQRGYAGEIKVANFTLVNEPRLSRIVGSSPTPQSKSLSQAVGKDLRTERAFFDHSSAKVAYDNGRLRVADGIIRGPVFGSSFAGTIYDPSGQIDISGSFMPAYGINRVFGAIPLVGQILGNGNEGGLIGLTYRVSGAFSSPTLVVNPISAIAPGIFRQIFAFD
ncbi:AsmA-like C-terminal region-containing protein [Aureimonas sp. ME7]|uniref:AsmA-like C-terminal region-containing protein n=1 Tax=Aureimonas sp. ME7 TaxID=2744252 RepID=UPI0015F6E530|nr:AsmA-like C-terminal region-containing protein [Aureimonas sp. ME7]